MTASILTSGLAVKPVAVGRQSRPPSWNPFAGGGVGFIPRRHLPPGLASMDGLLAGAQLNAYAGTYLFRLAEVLRDIDPTWKQATTNDIAICFGDNSTEFIAYGKSETGRYTVRDPGATDEIEQFLLSQPQEYGGVTGLQTTFLLNANMPGMACLEVVPGKRLEGLKEIIPVDPLTILLGRENGDPNNPIVPFQQTNTEIIGPFTNDRFYWRSMMATPANPYGAGRHSAVLNYALRNMSRNRNIDEAVRNAAYPRYAIIYSLDAQALFASTPQTEGGLGMHGLELTNYLADYEKELVEAFENLRPDENVFMRATNTFNPVPAGDFSGLQEPLKLGWREYSQALLSQPSMLGLVEGGNQTRSTVEWGIQAQGYEYARAWVNSLITWALEKHFILMGKDYRVKAECEPIRTSDAVQDANAEATRTATVTQWFNAGAITLEEYSMLLTGTDLPDASDEPEAVERQNKAKSEGISDNTTDTAPAEDQADMPAPPSTDTQDMPANDPQKVTE